MTTIHTHYYTNSEPDAEHLAKMLYRQRNIVFRFRRKADGRTYTVYLFHGTTYVSGTTGVNIDAHIFYYGLTGVSNGSDHGGGIYGEEVIPPDWIAEIAVSSEDIKAKMTADGEALADLLNAVIHEFHELSEANGNPVDRAIANQQASDTPEELRIIIPG